MSEIIGQIGHTRPKRERPKQASRAKARDKECQLAHTITRATVV